jgi:hypothetical protein
LINTDDAGFPPSSIENHRPDLLSREDLAAALYARLERTKEWSEFEDRLALDMRYPTLKPPEVLFGERSAVEKSESDSEDGELSATRKRGLAGLFFSRRLWYREYGGAPAK